MYDTVLKYHYLNIYNFLNPFFTALNESEQIRLL